MCIFKTVEKKERVGLEVGVSLPSQAESSPGTVEAELALSEWSEGNQRYPQPLPLDMQSYQIFPAVKTPWKWKQQLQRIFSLHHFIYQPSEPWLQGLSLDQPS